MVKAPMRVPRMGRKRIDNFLYCNPLYNCFIAYLHCQQSVHLSCHSAHLLHPYNHQSDTAVCLHRYQEASGYYVAVLVDFSDNRQFFAFSPSIIELLSNFVQTNRIPNFHVKPETCDTGMRSLRKFGPDSNR